MSRHSNEINTTIKLSQPFVLAKRWLVSTACLVAIFLPIATTYAGGNETASVHNPSSNESPTLEANPNPDQNVALKKCGTALLKVLFWEVYESSLYTPNGTWQEDTKPFRLDIRYLRSISAEDLAKQTGKEWAEQGKTSPQHAQWQRDLRALWPDVTHGDVISLAVDITGESTFLFNGEHLGTLQDPQFGTDFSGIWLAEDTTRPKLRMRLIGLKK
jgi:hypothetical protein